ncbi:energy-coupling factor ABC transporter permease [Marinomonas gallaica]|uniref:energy-coupling factor ABC transporter permease n=1 Tax=Marinomonas gallaica TaxID=1806667 RepID=UPI0008317875|nr:energy-coupling factor ABC transporter permease [Marinomonas gallaica]
MNFTSQLFSQGFEWVCWLFVILIVGRAFVSVPWSTLLHDGRLQNRFLGSVVALVLLWQMSVDLNVGVIIHFIGMTTITLFFGWPLAIVAGIVAQSVDLFWALNQWPVYGVNLMFNVIIPVALTWWMHCFIERFKPSNPFVFILGAGFFGCVVSTTVSSLVAVVALKLFGEFELKLSAEEYLGYLPIFVFPEAVVNGMFISATTILYPHVVTTFNEARYFKESKRDMILDEYIEPALDLDQTEAPEEQDDSRYRPPKEWYDKDKEP